MAGCAVAQTPAATSTQPSASGCYVHATLGHARDSGDISLECGGAGGDCPACDFVDANHSFRNQGPTGTEAGDLYSECEGGRSSLLRDNFSIRGG